MKKGVKKLLSILLTAAMLVSLLQGIPLFASASVTDGNYIFNNGNSADVVVKNGTDTAVTTKPSATKFGNALAIVPTKTLGSGWAKIPAKVPAKFDFSTTNGVAMYVKFPVDVDTTNLTIRIINEGWSSWYEIDTNVSATIVDTEGVKKEVTWAAPFENMQGFEGYVFVPYTALTKGEHPTVDPRETVTAWNWNIEICYYKGSERDINKEYLFDQIGYYSDVDSYIALSEKDLIDANYIVNRGTTSGVTTTYGADITVAAAAEATKLGDAIGATLLEHTGAAYGGDGWVQVPADVSESDFDFSATKGIAMYVKIPSDVTNSDFRVRIIRKDWADGSWWATNIDRNFLYASLDGVKINQSTTQHWEPFESHAGYEGFVFIPWESMDSNGAVDKAVIDPSILNGSDWQIEINFYDADTTRYGKTYYFDEIGFYSSVEGYVREAADLSAEGNEVFNSGTVDTVTYTGDCEITATEVEGVSPFGTALNIKPTKTKTAGWVKVKTAVDASFNFSKAVGIATYVKFDANMPTMPLLRIINGEWSSWATVNAGGAVTLYANGAAVDSTWSLENLKGFEGFVFIPFTSFDKTYLNANIYYDKYNWNIEVGYWSEDEASYQVDYIFDEMGFYSDIDIYRSIATGIVPTGNHIFNSGDSSNMTVTYGYDVETSTVKEESVTGDMISISPTKQLGGGWGRIPAAIVNPADTFDMKTVKGVAMYIKFPNIDCNQSYMEMRFINASETVYNLSYGTIPLTLVALDGTVTEVTTAFHEQNVLAGFEGFMFIPISCFAGISGATLNATDWNLEIGYYAKTETSGAGTYLFDEIGFYSDVEEYIELVKQSRINELLNVTEIEDGSYINVTDNFDVAGNIGGLLSLGFESTLIYGDANGDEIAEDAVVTTGHTIGVMTEDDYVFYTVVRYGDVNGDYNIDVRDLVRFKKGVADDTVLEPANAAACTKDSKAESELSATDLAEFRQMLLGK